MTTHDAMMDELREAYTNASTTGVADDTNTHDTIDRRQHIHDLEQQIIEMSRLRVADAETIHTLKIALEDEHLNATARETYILELSDSRQPLERRITGLNMALNKALTERDSLYKALSTFLDVARHIDDLCDTYQNAEGVQQWRSQEWLNAQKAAYDVLVSLNAYCMPRHTP